MLKYLLTTALLLTPVLASAVPTRADHRGTTDIFSASELNNLARLDEMAPPARMRRMETEIAVLQDQVGRMKLDRLIDTVLVDSRTTARMTKH